MEWTYIDSSDRNARMLPIVLSVILHLAGILVIFFWMTASSKPKTQAISALDVKLLDIQDIQKEPARMPSKPKSAKKSKARPKARRDLTDPSEAELKKMKHRKKTKKSSPDEEEFTMRENLFAPGSGKTKGTITLDSGNFHYYYYLSMLKTRISDNWIPPYGIVKSADDARRVVIHFIIDRSGKILSSEIEESSGVPLLDQSALRAVIVSGPFPPLPDAFPDASLGVHFGFRCELS